MWRCVQITMAENFGVQGRGAFYEQAGAIRDVVQNHLLQLLCNIAMEPPPNMEIERVRDEKVKVLRSIRTLSAENVVRGQFAGYRNEPGVQTNSQVETYVALRLAIDSWRWRGVPFYIRAGKSIASYRDGSAWSNCAPLRQFRCSPAANNYFRFRVTPNLEIAVAAMVKESGDQFLGQMTELMAHDRSIRRKWKLTRNCWTTRCMATRCTLPVRTTSKKHGESSTRFLTMQPPSSRTIPELGVRREGTPSARRMAGLIRW